MDTDVSDAIHVDQLGYRPNDIKRAVLPEDCEEFHICQASDGVSVFTAEASQSRGSLASGERVRVADFTVFATPGEYFISDGKGRSYTFAIAENPYGELRATVLNFFEMQRCGTEIDAPPWSHPACHTGIAYVLDRDGQKTGETKAVIGGWHDAGDYSRYVIPGAMSVAQILLGYELAPNPDGNALDVAWFKIEWMLQMQDEGTGGVYHKIGCANFNALNEAPQDEKGEIVLSPISPAATAAFSATMAMASRFYPDHSAELLEAARRAWVWADENPGVPGFRNPPGVVTGEYAGSDPSDMRYWAASELFVATGDETYHDYLKSSKVYTGMGWTSLGTYGIVNYLLRAGDKADAALSDKMKSALASEVKTVMDNYQKDPYGISLGGVYQWGSNMYLANNAAMLLLYNIIEPGEGYYDAALEHMSYLLGKNALSQSYITGFGSNASKDPHHRLSVAAGQTVLGMVVGGPNGKTNDDPVLNANRKGEPPMKCYIDNRESYASNEVAIYWNSPVYLLLALLDF
uniref:Endoglucanase n=1 Tax=uncultured bacterium contig00102 TaxID=1181569 RepID=A0A806KMJ3_9BACT|nr:cellodextrinase [uncultured bacterium contig00102]